MAAGLHRIWWAAIAAVAACGVYTAAPNAISLFVTDMPTTQIHGHPGAVGFAPRTSVPQMPAGHVPDTALPYMRDDQPAATPLRLSLDQPPANPVAPTKQPEGAQGLNLNFFRHWDRRITWAAVLLVAFCVARVRQDTPTEGRTWAVATATGKKADEEEEKKEQKDIMERLLPEDPSGGVSLFKSAGQELRYWLVGGEAPVKRDPRWMIRDDQEEDFENRRKDPKPYAWDEPISIWKSSFSPVKRRKFWRILVVSVIAMALASATLKAITFTCFQVFHPHWLTDLTFNAEVNGALAQAERIIHYQEFMGHIDKVAPAELADSP